MDAIRNINNYSVNTNSGNVYRLKTADDLNLISWEKPLLWLSATKASQ
jgi:hypothetical protein